LLRGVRKEEEEEEEIGIGLRRVSIRQSAAAAAVVVVGACVQSTTQSFAPWGSYYYRSRDFYLDLLLDVPVQGMKVGGKVERKKGS
jgi:hypothetical protein